MKQILFSLGVTQNTSLSIWVTVYSNIYSAGSALRSKYENTSALSLGCLRNYKWYVHKYKKCFYSEKAFQPGIWSFLCHDTFGSSQTLRDTGVAWLSSEHGFLPLSGPLSCFSTLQGLGHRKKQQGGPSSELSCFCKRLRGFHKVSLQFYYLCRNNPLHQLQQLLSEVYICSFTHALYLIRLKPGSI